MKNVLLVGILLLSFCGGCSKAAPEAARFVKNKIANPQADPRSAYRWVRRIQNWMGGACETCQGGGVLGCSVCGATGSVNSNGWPVGCPNCTANNWSPIITCPACNGTGKQ